MLVLRMVFDNHLNYFHEMKSDMTGFHLQSVVFTSQLEDSGYTLELDGEKSSGSLWSSCWAGREVEEVGHPETQTAHQVFLYKHPPLSIFPAISWPRADGMISVSIVIFFLASDGFGNWRIVLVRGRWLEFFFGGSWEKPTSFCWGFWWRDERKYELECGADETRREELQMLDAVCGCWTDEVIMELNILKMASHVAFTLIPNTPHLQWFSL